MTKKEKLKINKNQGTTANSIQSKAPSSFIKIFLIIILTFLAIGFISLVCFVFYWQEIGKTHLPDELLKFLLTAASFLIIRSFLIMIKAQFTNNSS